MAHVVLFDGWILQQIKSSALDNSDHCAMFPFLGSCGSLLMAGSYNKSSRLLWMMMINEQFFFFLWEN